jgi:hypothetical protein
MIIKAKLALIVAVAALFASPALARTFDGHHSIGREMTARHAGAHHTHRNGLNAYASEQRILLLGQLLLNAILARTSIKARIAAFRTTLAAKV